MLSDLVRSYKDGDILKTHSEIFLPLFLRTLAFFRDFGFKRSILALTICEVLNNNRLKTSSWLAFSLVFLATDPLKNLYG